MPSMNHRVARFTLLICMSLCVSMPAPANDVGEKAVLFLSFDNGENPQQSRVEAELTDKAASGTTRDEASLSNGAAAIPSVFAPSESKSSLLLDARKKQVISIANSTDISQPNAVTISGLFASLHPLTEAVMHGLLAKRQPAAPFKTNYGINFMPSSDSFQLYVNDGSGFKVAIYSVKDSIGFRKRVHLSASFQTADAPNSDTDTDEDDVRIRLFVNGIPAAPVKVTAGLIDGTSAWLQDVRLDNCQSDAPLTIGGSFVDGELSSIICDDIRIFPFALTDDQAANLFHESAGNEATAITNEKTNASPVDSLVPVIGRLSPNGLTIGQENQLTVFGRNLQDAILQIDLSGLEVTSVAGTRPNQRDYNIMVPADAVPGRYLARLISSTGVSKPVVISIDGLLQFNGDAFTEGNPLKQLPAAISGTLTGTEQKRIYFGGIAGQEIVAEIEAQRIGSKLDPVVEIKSAAGTPLSVQWQQPSLAGDARTSAKLPADGVYFVEVHDLQYRAPGNSYYRVLLGEIPESSVAYPPAITLATTELRTVGINGVSNAVQIRNSPEHRSIEQSGHLVPFPHIVESALREITEPFDGAFDSTPIDATFAVAPFAPLYVSGRISTPSQTDQIVLTVTPGHALRFEAKARSMNSPLRPQISLFSGDSRVAFSDGESGSKDPFFDYTVPENVTQLTLKVSDFTERGTPGSVYRVLIARKDRPAFELAAPYQSLRLPVNGSVPIKLQVIRQSPSYRYTGPIRFYATGVSGVSLIPNFIPASDNNQDIIVVVTRDRSVSGSTEIPNTEHITIWGESDDSEPKVTAALKMDLELPGRSQTTFYEPKLTASDAPQLEVTAIIDGPPPILLRGLSSVLPIRILPLSDIELPFVRFELLTTEKERLSDPNNPNSAPKEMIAALEFQFGLTSESEFKLHINVPSDVDESEIDAIVGAHLTRQPLDLISQQIAWTAPIRLRVEDAMTLKGPGDVKGGRNSAVSVTGTLIRHPQFSQEANVTVAGLPNGYTINAATVAPDQSEFELTINVPESASPGDVPNLTLQAQSSAGVRISPMLPLKLTIE